MELYIAGGVGEHGRNCFYVKGETLSFLVDCGRMADTPDDPYPRLNSEQISGLTAVFLTHSHADHTGALPWLNENGFRGSVIASSETLRQLTFTLKKSCALDTLCPGGAGQFNDMRIQWGRSGHCAGSVWYRFSEYGESILFSGDYTEDSPVYNCDSIRGHVADCAVLDCAYGRDDTPFDAACERLIEKSKQMLSAHKLLLYPVPKYGRGLDILKLFSSSMTGAKYYADELMLENIAKQRAGGFWYRPVDIAALVQPYAGQSSGIVFVSDPQLRSAASRQVAQQVLGMGGMAVMTGTVERGSYSEQLLRCGSMVQVRYPVHLNYVQAERLKSENSFSKTIFYHSPEFSGR